MPLPQGTKLGPYEIQSQLGAGGMGEVYRAGDPRLARNVAVKILCLSHLPQTLTVCDGLNRRRAQSQRRKDGRTDLEAVESALRAALHRAGAAALTQLPRFSGSEALFSITYDFFRHYVR